MQIFIEQVAAVPIWLISYHGGGQESSGQYFVTRHVHAEKDDNMACPILDGSVA